MALDYDNSEALALNLLSEMQVELSHCLNALGGRQGAGLHEFYPGYTTAHLNCSIEGYLLLRRNGRSAASKLLVRTAIEAVIRERAVQLKPELLFRIAFTEFREDEKWITAAAIGDVAGAVSELKQKWEEFKRVYHRHYPLHSVEEKKLSLREAAECAGIEKYYDSHYRLYCKFTHAAFRATTGTLNAFDTEDTRTMVLCALSGLEGLSKIGSPSSRFEEFQKRVTELQAKS